MTKQKTIEERLGALEKRVSSLETQQNQESKTNRRKLTLKEFVLEKNPKGNVQKTLIISSYLQNCENMSSVNTAELTKYFRSAREPVPKNLNDIVNQNIKKGHMFEAEEKKNGKKAWFVTNTGEQFIKNGFKDPK